MKKRLLLFVMMLLPMVAIADESGTCGTNLTWTYTEATKTLTIEGSGAMNNYIGINNYFTCPWYKYSDEIVIIIIGDYVTSIGEWAFCNCSSLKSITIPNSVTSIGKEAFYNCSGLKSITIPNSVTSIGSHAFNGCSGLTSITIPNSVTSIGEFAFSNCTGLTSIKVEAGNPNYDSRDNCNAIIRTANNALILGCITTKIPNSVTSIGSHAFNGCSGLTSITIPNSVTSIGDASFANCSSLTSVTIPNSVTSIGDSAFAGCSSLKSITIPNSVISIEKSAFSRCTDLTSIKVEAGNPNYDSRDNCNAIIRTADNALISGCMKTTIPNSVTLIGESAFKNCTGLTSITIPNSVTGIAHHAFNGCTGLTSITIPNSVTGIGQLAFAGCTGLTSITIPNSMTYIGGYVFVGCTGLTSITIPNSVTSIGQAAFSGCTGLTSIIIPNSMRGIDTYAFNSCSNLQNIYCYAIRLPNTITSAFYDANTANATLHVPANSLSLYQTTAPWSDFGTIVPLTDDDPNPTGVDEVKIKKVDVEGTYFDLNGRRLNGAPTHKGVYINNGKKVVVN